MVAGVCIDLGTLMNFLAVIYTVSNTTQITSCTLEQKNSKTLGRILTFSKTPGRILTTEITSQCSALSLSMNT